MTDRKKPSVAFWAIVALVVALMLAGYPFVWGRWIRFELAHHSALPAPVRTVGDAAFAPLSRIRRCGLLPAFYDEYIDESIREGMRLYSKSIR
jgi:hypothetical protein